MQQPIGTYIRQVRRQRSITQTELGGERFSKSYVSAVERGTITPSRAALRFFAEQLDLPVDTLEALVQQNEHEQATSLIAVNDSVPTPPPSTLDNKEITMLLDMVLEGTEIHSLPLAQYVSIAADETLAQVPLPLQARYLFLQGLAAQKQQQFGPALLALEQALALAPQQIQPAILDALGTNYFLMGLYQVALAYHKRALHSLQKNTIDHINPGMLLSIEIHCGDDYRMLGMHTCAYEHYGRARNYLRSTHNIQMAGRLYQGLGYCIYTSIYQCSPSTPRIDEEHEQMFQQAISFLVQSRTLYQVGCEPGAESSVRLMQAMVELDYCVYRKQRAQDQAKNSATPLTTYCGTLLDEVEEQSRQVLLLWQEKQAPASIMPTEVYPIIYTALLYLVRAATQRASLAQIAGYKDTAIRERSRAIYLYQKALDILSAPSFSWEKIHEVLVPSNYDREVSFPPLPHVSSLAEREQHEPWIGEVQAELFFAAGELMEEIGRSATNTDYAYNCYTRADECLRLTLTKIHQVLPNAKCDINYLTRWYQRSIALLEERNKAFPEATEETMLTITSLLKESVSKAHYPAPAEIHVFDTILL